MVQEKRKSKRVKEDFSILCKTYRKIELEGTVSKILDISLSGLAFLTNTRFLKGDLLQIIFRIPPDFQEKIELFGRIVDAEPTIETGLKIRVAFLGIDSNTISILNRIIDQANFKSTFKK